MAEIRTYNLAAHMGPGRLQAAVRSAGARPEWAHHDRASRPSQMGAILHLGSIVLGCCEGSDLSYHGRDIFVYVYIYRYIYMYMYIYYIFIYRL